MTQDEFIKHHFSITTRIKVDGEWHCIAEVNFENDSIRVPFKGWVSIDKIEDIK